MDAKSLDTRMRVGYMSQAFSLYGELTVAQNLWIHARLYHLPPESRRPGSTSWSSASGSSSTSTTFPNRCPLGVRQRLSLAVAIIHDPEMLILDEPTSGVDPVARDEFWELLIDLSRQKQVTIFISTHFMNEAMRCDRISLMHAGVVLACDTPSALVAARGTASLEEAFIAYIADATGEAKTKGATPTTAEADQPRRSPRQASERSTRQRQSLLQSRPSPGLQPPRDAGDPAATRCGWPSRSSARWS